MRWIRTLYGIGLGGSLTSLMESGFAQILDSLYTLLENTGQLPGVNIHKMQVGEVVRALQERYSHFYRDRDIYLKYIISFRGGMGHKVYNPFTETKESPPWTYEEVEMSPLVS